MPVVIKDGSAVRLYSTRFLKWYGYGTLVSCLNVCTKRTVLICTVRFMCSLWPSIKIRATVLIELKIHDIAAVAGLVFTRMSRLSLI